MYACVHTCVCEREREREAGQKGGFLQGILDPSVSAHVAAG